MKIKLYFVLSLMLLLPAAAWADFDPKAYYTVDGDDFEESETINDAQAPLRVTFKANPSNIDEGTVPSYEWKFVKDGSTNPYITRYEENTEFEFRESGVTAVSLYVSYGDGNDPELISTIRVSISTSLLEMPNAFSPNGDGINDIYKAKDNHKSIVEFKAYIFNRWGQQMAHLTDPSQGWDGKSNGKTVPAGVYFYVIRAEGADGKQYKLSGDINVVKLNKQSKGHNTTN